MKVLDLYSGIGGWSLGMSMAGLEVVASYDIWQKANLTNSRNNHHTATRANIREIDPYSLPRVDVVVGSPPCTQFSLANRGGKGDIADGLKDVEKFLEIVEAIRPEFWAMENVPRLESIARREFDQGGVLHKFCHLKPEFMVLDLSEWGVPQRRQRLLVGNINFDLLRSYSDVCPRRTLGDVIRSLSGDPAVDPVYGTIIPVSDLTDNIHEPPFSDEEARINRDSKSFHPIYNNMSFPDDTDRPSRTVTATSTRISRESIVISSGSGFRRPTVRESASIQSFPIGYQFYGDSHADKIKMIGNAFPPLATFYIGHAILGTSVSSLPEPSEGIKNFRPPAEMPKMTSPQKPSKKYSPGRKFRAAVPGLRFKSGVRFELSNSPAWSVKFFYGNSKDIREISLGQELLDKMEMAPGVGRLVARANNSLVEVGGILNCSRPDGLQSAWNHSSDDYTHPYDLVDSIGNVVKNFLEKDDEPLARTVVSELMKGSPPGFQKVVKNSREVFAGLVVGSLVNEVIKS